MDIISILPDSVANQIAAGEVVDRPAGAVKELLENSMDAGATQIDLVIKDAGRTLIQVTDNGSGMSDSDARLCFERHATSKIHHSDDLFAIHTMGFRGEALASIAAIAQVELRTRQLDSELGTVVHIEASRISNQQPILCPAGTTIAVKNLFFNVPARRNFLKKDSIEMSHIEETFRRVSLVHHDIAFTLTSNEKNIYNLPRGSMHQRICGLFGKQYQEKLYAVDEDTDLVRIHGFVSRPEFYRRNRGEQYIFVNGRYIKHPALSTAVEKAYVDMLPERTYPSYFIGLQVDPSRIDINIHPTKTEVKFIDEQALFAILRAAVKRALGQFSLATELSFDTPEEFNIGPAPKGYLTQQPQIKFNTSYNPFHASPTQTKLKSFENDLDRISGTLHQTAPTNQQLVLTDVSSNADRNIGANNSIHPCIQIQGRYIVTAITSGLVVIDQKRAHERIIYDGLINDDQKVHSGQSLLFPVGCRFSAADAELLGELLPDLRTYGFSIDPIGECTFMVTATPPEFKENQIQSFFDQLLSDYKGATLQKFNIRSQTLCASLARQMAIRYGEPLGQEQMQQLVADLFACPMADLSPSGKRIITIIKPEELLK